MAVLGSTCQSTTRCITTCIQMDRFQLWQLHRLKLARLFANQQMVTEQTLVNWCTSKWMVCEMTVKETTTTTTLQLQRQLFICAFQNLHVSVFNQHHKRLKRTKRYDCCVNRKVTDQFEWNGVCWTGHCSMKCSWIHATTIGPWRRAPMTKKAEHFLLSKLTLSELDGHSASHSNSNWAPPIVMHLESKRFLLKRSTRRQTTSRMAKQRAQATVLAAARARQCLRWIQTHSCQYLRLKGQTERTREFMSAKQATTLDGLS